MPSEYQTFCNELAGTFCNVYAHMNETGTELSCCVDTTFCIWFRSSWLWSSSSATRPWTTGSNDSGCSCSFCISLHQLKLLPKWHGDHRHRIIKTMTPAPDPKKVCFLVHAFINSFFHAFVRLFVHSFIRSRILLWDWQLHIQTPTSNPRIIHLRREILPPRSRILHLRLGILHLRPRILPLNPRILCLNPRILRRRLKILLLLPLTSET